MDEEPTETEDETDDEVEEMPGSWLLSWLSEMFGGPIPAPGSRLSTEDATARCLEKNGELYERLAKQD